MTDIDDEAARVLARHDLPDAKWEFLNPKTQRDYLLMAYALRAAGLIKETP